MAVGFPVKALAIAVSTVPATIYGCEQQYFCGRALTNAHRSIACALGPSGQHRNPGLVVALGCPPSVDPEQGIVHRRFKAYAWALRHDPMTARYVRECAEQAMLGKRPQSGPGQCLARTLDKLG
eukprot:10347229-Heterocapsa_arctica.AAC.1